jgi:hypothetical protein
VTSANALAHPMRDRPDDDFPLASTYVHLRYVLQVEFVAATR